MVLAAMLVSAWTAADKTPDRRALFHALLGAAGVIVGAIAFNQRSNPARMRKCRAPPAVRCLPAD